MFGTDVASDRTAHKNMGISATSGPVATPLSTRVCTLYTHLHAHIVRHRTVWEQSRVVSFCGRCRSVSIGSDKAALCGLYLRSHCSGCLQIWHKGAHAICARAITFSEHHIGWEQSWQPPNTCACTHTPPTRLLTSPQPSNPSPISFAAKYVSHVHIFVPSVRA